MAWGSSTTRAVAWISGRADCLRPDRRGDSCRAPAGWSGRQAVWEQSSKSQYRQTHPMASMTTNSAADSAGLCRHSGPAASTLRAALYAPICGVPRGPDHLRRSPARGRRADGPGTALQLRDDGFRMARTAGVSVIGAYDFTDYHYGGPAGQANSIQFSIVYEPHPPAEGPAITVGC